MKCVGQVRKRTAQDGIQACMFKCLTSKGAYKTRKGRLHV